MLPPGLLSPCDTAIEKRIDGLPVNAAHRESARASYRHSIATVDDVLEVVEDFQRFARSLRTRFSVRRGIAIVATVSAIALSGVLAASPPVFTATRIPAPAGHSSGGQGINARGDVTGWWTMDAIARSFRFDADGTAVDIGNLGRPSAYSQQINDAGVIVGISSPSAGFEQSFVYEQGAMRALIPPTSVSGGAMAINNAGDIAGSYLDASFNRLGYLYTNAQFTLFGSLGGGNTFPFDINASGVVVGHSRDANQQMRAFVYRDGAMTDLGTLGGPTSLALGINARGDIVGYADVSGPDTSRAFLYTDGAMTSLGTLGGARSFAWKINQAGQIVGQSEIASGATMHAFLFTEGELFDLNTLVSSGLNGAVLTQARAINLSGQVVASACVPAAGCQAFRLDPTAPAGKARAIEYYHAAFDHYFLSTINDEITKLDNGTFAGWSRTGAGIHVDVTAPSGAVPVCRFFSASFAPKSSHFYTPFASECDTVKRDPAWTFEGDVFHIALPDGAGACASGRVPVYRLYNNGMSGAPNHRYTTSVAVRAAMIARGWIPEGLGAQGVIMCV